jgi:two-component system, NarL family, sensor histidine kinase UhpB
LNPPVAAHSPSGLPNLLHGVIDKLPWLVLSLALTGTLASWYFARASVFETARIEFESTVKNAIDDIQDRMHTYEQVLRGGVALFSADGSIDRATWLKYVEGLEIEASYPGIQAIGYAQAIEHAHKESFLQVTRAGDDALYRIRPDGDRDAYTPIVHIAPFEGANAGVLGYDMYSEPTRRAALEQARESGEAVLSAKAVLVQEIASVREQAGTLMFLAVYHRGMPHRTPQERRAALQGYVYGAFRMADLMRNTLDAKQYRAVDIEIFDGGNATPDSLLFDGDSVRHTFARDFPTPFTGQQSIIIAGQPWTLKFFARPEFALDFDPGRAQFALVGGAIMSLLLFGAAWMLSRSWQISQTLAQSMTSAYHESEARLDRFIHSAMDAIITIDPNQNIILFNPAAEVMFRCKASDAIGKSLEIFIPQRFRAAHHQHVERFGATGVTSRAMGREVVLSGLRFDGEEFPIDASISQVEHDGSKLFTVVLRDITTRKAAEVALRTSNLKLRELSTYAESVREAERIRIAREIHDEIAATLTAVKMDLVATASLAQSGLNALEERLPRAINLMDAAVSTTRRIINDLRPSILDNLGVWAAIEWQTGEMAQRAGISHRVDIADELLAEELPAPRTTALFRIVQEALTNIWRHAEATRVSVRIYRERDDVVVEIEDDGKGSTEIDLAKDGHWGIMGMSERARSQGGHMSVNGARGRGTMILVRLPLR